MIKLKSIIGCLILTVEVTLGMQLELKSDATLTGSEMTLGDLIQSMEEGRQEYWNLPLGLSPALGTERIYNRDHIERAIRSRIGKTEITWHGTQSVRVSRPARTVLESEIKSIITQQLATLIGEKQGAVVHEVSEFTSFMIPAGETEFQMDFASSTNQSSWSSVVMRVMSKGDSVLTKSFRFRWSWMKTAWIATQNKAAGDLLGVNDFKAVTLDLLQQPPGVFTATMLPSESTLGRNIAAGKTLMMNDFKPRVVVKKGSSVFVHYQVSGVSVSMQGVALEDGARGNMINIQNPSSRKRMLARVVDESNTIYAN